MPSDGSGDSSGTTTGSSDNTGFGGGSSRGGGPIGSESGAGYNTPGISNIGPSGMNSSGSINWGKVATGVMGFLSGNPIAGGISLAQGFSDYSPATLTNPDPNAGNAPSWGGGGGSAASWGSALGGLLGSATSAGGSGSAGSADPFGGQRQQYQQQLQALMSNPNSFAESPAAKAAIASGTGQISAQMAARGLSSSGAEKQALTKFATQTAMGDYYQQLQALMALSGVNSGSPGMAAQLQAAQRANDIAGLGALGSQIGSWAGQYWGGDGGADAATTYTDMTGFRTDSAPVDYNTWLGGGSTDTGGTLGFGTWEVPGDYNPSLTDFLSF